MMVVRQNLIVILLLLLLQAASGFVITKGSQKHSTAIHLSDDDNQRDSPLVSRRRVLIGTTTAFLFPSIAQAKEKLSPQDALERIRQELQDPKGGIAYLEEALKKENYSDILEFTKTYDQVLRKSYMGQAKKLILDKDKATSLCNAVTFDLIGINRNSRPNQESQVDAQKYLQELQNDVKAFLELERQSE